jgi:hypothetical protein
MKRIILLMLVLFAFATVGSAFAENPVDKVAPKKQTMQMYHIAMAQKGPNWKSQSSQEGMDVRREVIEGIKKGAQSGLVISAGLVNDETPVEFIIILDMETKTEAYNLLQKAKNVKNGFFSVMIYSYFAPKGLAFQK